MNKTETSTIVKEEVFVQVERKTNLKQILNTKRKIGQFVKSFSAKFNMFTKLLWLEQVIRNQSLILKYMCILLPLSRSRALISRGMVKNSQLKMKFLLGLLVPKLIKSIPGDLVFLYMGFNTASYFFSLLCNIVYSWFSKDLTNSVIKKQEDYVIRKSHEDYVNYKKSKDRSDSISVLVDELNSIWEVFSIRDPFTTFPVNMVISAIIVRSELVEIIYFCKMLSNLFSTIFLITGVMAVCFVNYYIKILNAQTKDQIVGYILLKEFVKHLSDFSTKIMCAFALNRIQERRDKLDAQLDEALETQKNIDKYKTKGDIADFIIQLYYMVSPQLFIYVISYINPTVKGFLSFISFIVVNQVYYVLIQFVINNYKHHVSLLKVYDVLELDDRDEKPMEVYTNIRREVPSDIYVNNLSFYIDEGDRDRKILSNISFDIKAGQKVAVIGPSGSGKSTLMKLLAGFMGKIPQITPSVPNWNFRSNTLLLAQDPIFYMGSVKENIVGFNKEILPEEVIEFGITGFLISKVLSSDARELSGGEKQRVALARAVHALNETSCSTLILDESFSALDPEFKHKCLNRLLCKYKDKTIININHDPMILHKFNKILYLENGELIFKGSYEEFRKTPLYQSYISFES